MKKRVFYLSLPCICLVMGVVLGVVYLRHRKHQSDPEQEYYDELFTLEKLEEPCVLVTMTYSKEPAHKVQPGVASPMPYYILMRMDLQQGMVYWPNDHHSVIPTETVRVGVEITRNVSDPDRPGNILLDFIFRAVDETLEVKDVSWNQRDFQFVAQGSYWAAYLTGIGEAEVSQ